ncbi:hypothetical protein AXF42_Ash013613 [Apostasia shenzhenica]|uniref:DUF6821 domain-containing protein n=1 Tax=Apostasia shenzhenica TaxID=1088818 RepID=A0A2I0APH6_9ASPA|nr:hypothetical protein AXF42_Ash013613 [Apostasia shenzhenica]
MKTKKFEGRIKQARKYPFNHCSSLSLSHLSLISPLRLLSSSSSHLPRMDLEEWELLPDNTSILEFGLQDVQDLSKEIIYMDYFREEPNVIQPNFIHSQEEEEEEDKEEDIQFEDIGVSHVCFKIKPMEVTQFKPPPVTLAVELSNGCEIEESRGLEEEGEKEKEKENNTKKPRLEKFSISFCGWRLTGVRAVCSAGAAAAAAIFIVVMGGGRQQKLHQQQRRLLHHSHILQFQIHADDKRLKQGVQQGSRLNQAVTAPAMMRPAKISFGGNYDGLI